MIAFESHIRAIFSIYILLVGCQGSISAGGGATTKANAPTTEPTSEPAINNTQEQDASNTESTPNANQLALNTIMDEIKSISDKLTDKNISPESLQVLLTSLNILISDIETLQAEIEAQTASDQISAITTALKDATTRAQNLMHAIEVIQQQKQEQVAASLLASLTLASDSTADLSPVPYSSSRTIQLTLSNVGTGEAGNIGFPSISSPWQISDNTCGSTLVSGSNCTIDLTYVSPGVNDGTLTFAVEYNPNPSAEKRVVSDQIILEGTAAPVVVAPVFPINGVNWMNYILRGGANSRFDDPDVTCPDPWGPLNGCFHAGELRQVILPNGSPGCNDLSIAEHLDAFDWECLIVDTKTVFRSTSLGKGKGLQNLVSDTGWIANRITISTVDTVIYQSDLASWWTNPVTELPENPTPPMADLSVQGTIYVLSQTKYSEGYRVTAPQIAVVTLPGATLKYAGSGTLNCGQWSSCSNTTYTQICLVNSIESDYGWIEGRFDAKPAAGTSADVGVLGCYFSSGRMHRVTGMNAVRDGIWLEGSFNTLLTDIQSANNQRYGLNLHYIEQVRVIGARLANNGSHGVRVYDSYTNRYAGIRTYNNAGHGFSSDFGFDDDLVDVVSAFNTLDGISMLNQWYGGHGFHALTAFGNDGNGIVMDDADESILSQVVTVGNNLDGLRFDGYGGNPTVANLVSAHNNGDGIETAFSAPSGSINFASHLIVDGNGGSNCKHLQGTGFSNACVSGATLHSTLNLASPATFAGPVSSDSLNSADDNGTHVDAAAVSDWFGMENDHRVWGPDAASALSAKGRCTVSTCRIWDLSLLASSQLFNRSQTFSATNEAFQVGATCPAGANGNDFVQSFAAQTRYLKNAIEIVDDFIGDNDGLCESNEACIYMPHFGSFVGPAPLTGACQFQDGTIAGVTLLSK